MVSEKLVKALNDQMNFEFESANVYLATAAYCASESLDGFANFFLVQAEEERFHAMKFFNFINDIGHRATISQMAEPVNDYKSVLDAFEQGLEHEKAVSKKIYDIADIALDEREHATMAFLKWFIEEQVEEEASFDAIIQKLRRIENDSNAFFMLDSEFATRKFTPPAE